MQRLKSDNCETTVATSQKDCMVTIYEFHASLMGDDDEVDELVQKSCHVCHWSKSFFDFFCQSNAQNVNSSFPRTKRDSNCQVEEKSDKFRALQSGKVTAKINKNAQFHPLIVNHNRIFVENDLSDLSKSNVEFFRTSSSSVGFLKMSSIIQILKDGERSLAIFVRDSNNKVEIIPIEFESFNDLEIFCNWIKESAKCKGKSRGKRISKVGTVPSPTTRIRSVSVGGCL